MTPDTHHPSKAFGACAEATPFCQRESDYTFPPLRVLPGPCLPEHEPGGHCPSSQPHPASSPSFIPTILSGLRAHAAQGHLALPSLGPRLFLVMFQATGELSLAPSAKWHPVQVCRINYLMTEKDLNSGQLSRSEWGPVLPRLLSSRIIHLGPMGEGSPPYLIGSTGIWWKLNVHHTHMNMPELLHSTSKT